MKELVYHEDMHAYVVCEDEVSWTVTGAGELTVGRNLQRPGTATA